MIPLFSALQAVLFLDEELFAYHGFGAILIAAGIFMVARYGRERIAVDASARK